MMNSSRANSPDWLTAVLERPVADASDMAGAKPSGWLSKLIGAGTDADADFVAGLPFVRPSAPFEPATKPLSEDDLAQGHSGEETSEMIGDDLVEILREALGESEPTDAASLELDDESEAEPNPEPSPDPIAEAFARGEAAGRLAANAEQERQASQKLELRQMLRAFDQAAMDALAGELADTVIALCSQALSDFVPDPDALKARCIKAAQRLGAGAGQVTLYLNPDDLDLIDKDGLGSWTIVGDPGVERGGLKFETEDGSVSDRPSDWRRAIATAIRG